MTQITLTLSIDNSTNPSILKKILSNVKGVLKVSVDKTSIAHSSKTSAEDSWKDDVRALTGCLEPSNIDFDDERTRYILRGSSLLHTTD